MDTPAVEGCGGADSFTSANISTISSSLFHPEELLTEEVPQNGRSKSVDPGEGVNGARLQTSAGSVPTESYDAVSAIAVASARAAVVASAVSSMTALVAAVTYPPSRQQYNARISSGSTLQQQVVSSEARGCWRTWASSSLRPGVSAGEFLSPFEGFAPWPKEGRNGREDGDGSEWDKPSTRAPAYPLSEGATAGSTNNAYPKHHQPSGLSRKCGYPGGCDNIATHVPPRLLLRGPAAAPEVKAEPTPAASTDSSCPPSFVSPKANGESEVVEESSPRNVNGGGDAGAGGVTTEARSGDGANNSNSSSSSSSSIPAEATEAVRASDGVSSAATVALNGKGEIAVDDSGASSSGAGAVSVVEKDVSSGDGEAGVPSTGVDTSVGVRQPTRCSEHAGPGWIIVYGEDNGVVGLEKTQRNDYFWGDDDGMEGGAADRSSTQPESAFSRSTSSPQATDPAAQDKGKAKSDMDLGGDGIDGEGTGGGKSGLLPSSPGGGATKGRFGKIKGINENCPHPHSKHYCRGKCKLCYMKEYNRRTRALNGGAGKVIQKPAADKRASSEGDAPTSPEGGAASPLAGLRKRRRTESETETNDSSSKDIVVTEKSWRKTISSCEHTDAPHYGKGFCRPCYMREYHRAKKKGGEVVRLPAPSRVEPGSKPPEAKGTSSSGSKEQKPFAAVGKAVASNAVGKAGVSAAVGKAGASATKGRARAAVVARTAAAMTGGGVGVGLYIRGLSTAVPKTTALPPPLCGVCGQTEKTWRLVLICDGCEESFHLGCQGLGNQPFGEWFCPSCTEILLDSDSDIEDKADLPENGRSSSSTPRRARRGKWPLKGDVRGCRCPICVSILLQSGCTRLAKPAGATFRAHGCNAEDAEGMEIKTEAPGSPAIKSLKARVRNSPGSGKAGDAKAETKKRSLSRAGDLLMYTDKGGAGTAVPAAAKRSKTPE